LSKFRKYHVMSINRVYYGGLVIPLSMVYMKTKILATLAPPGGGDSLRLHVLASTIVSTNVKNELYISTSNA
jgi:hypothetical protein